MNYNQKIFTEDIQTLVNSYGLLHDVIKVMTLCDGVAPSGACCGKNNVQIANKFINNKKNYMMTMKQIEQRKIKTIKSGIIYISPLKKMVNLNVISDAEIVKYVENGYISKDRFDWKGYVDFGKDVANSINSTASDTLNGVGGVEEIIKEEPIKEEEPEKVEEKMVEETKEIPQKVEQKSNRKGKNSK